MLENDPNRKQIEAVIDDIEYNILSIYKTNKEECARMLNMVLDNLPIYKMKAKREFGPTGPDVEDINIYTDGNYFGKLIIRGNKLFIRYESEIGIPTTDHIVMRVKIPTEVFVSLNKLITKGIINQVHLKDINVSNDFTETLREQAIKILIEIT